MLFLPNLVRRRYCATLVKHLLYKLRKQKNVDVQRCPERSVTNGDKLARPKSVTRRRQETEIRAAKAKSAGDVDFFQLWTVRKASLFLMDACG